jgi:hypothetical protein
VEDLVDQKHFSEFSTVMSEMLNLLLLMGLLSLLKQVVHKYTAEQNIPPESRFVWITNEQGLTKKSGE